MRAREIGFTSRILGRGCVAYDVARCGTFTLGFNGSAYRLQDVAQDRDSLRVVYGEMVAERVDEISSTATVWPQAPKVNGVTLRGSACFRAHDADEHLDDPDGGHWAGWLGVWRGSPCVSAPAKTKARVADIVATLARDFLRRPDSDEMLADFRRDIAPARIESHRQALAAVEREIAEWQHRAEHERSMLAAQEAVMRGEHIPRVGPRPSWRDPRSAATADGAEFLRITTRRPRGSRAG